MILGKKENYFKGLMYHEFVHGLLCYIYEIKKFELVLDIKESKLCGQYVLFMSEINNLGDIRRNFIISMAPYVLLQLSKLDLQDDIIDTLIYGVSIDFDYAYNKLYKDYLCTLNEKQKDEYINHTLEWLIYLTRWIRYNLKTIESSFDIFYKELCECLTQEEERGKLINRKAAINHDEFSDILSKFEFKIPE